MKKTVLITGAGSGLGKMAAISLAKRGHLVYATTHYEKEAEALNDYAAQNQINLISFKLDILLEEDRNLLFSYDFDVLICNAAIGDSGSVAEIRIDRFQNVFETNVFCNIQIAQIAIQKMMKKKQGRILFLSSLAGRISMPFLAPYCASKFAIEAFATSLRKELKKLDGIDIQVGIIEPRCFCYWF